MKIRSDCRLKKTNSDYYLVAEHCSIKLGAISHQQLSVLCRARETEVDLALFFNQPLVNQLIENGIVIDTHNESADPLEIIQNTWFSYHHQRNINWKEFKKLNIGILGCGGTGSLICQSLAASGIKKFVLIDYDIITIDNINRQFTYHGSDVGNLKTTILEKLLQNDYGIKEIKVIHRYIENSSLLIESGKNLDLLICCADKPAYLIHLICADFSLKTGVPVLYGAVGFMKASIGPLLAGKDAAKKYKIVCQKIFSKMKSSFWEVNYPSNGATNSVVANLMAFEVIMFFLLREKCKIINSCFTVDFNSLAIEKEYTIK